MTRDTTAAALVIVISLYVFIMLVLSPSVEAGGEQEWEVLTKSNFSSQIRLHPNILLMVTLPWLGESRSLMKELAERVANMQVKYGVPRLMLLYKNKERMLADAIGAEDAITILFYHHSVSYRYQGRLRSQNILSSLHFLLTFPSEQFPIQYLNSQRELKTFLQSTDKAILLLEFCGWTRELLAKATESGDANDFDSLGLDISGENNESLTAGMKRNQASEIGKMSCDAQNEFSGIPWIQESSLISDSYLTKSTTDGVSCSFENFQKFDSFFTKLMTVAREFFLPPERQRLGLVADMSLLSTLEDGNFNPWLSFLKDVDSDSWLLKLYFSGCPTCSIAIKERDEIKAALQMQNPLVPELGNGVDDPDPTLPVNKPSVLLFIDRLSDSLETRRKSKETLNTFRSLAFQLKKLNGISSQFGIKTEPLLETHQQSKTFSGHQNNKLFSSSQNVAIKDMVSIVVVNEGKHIMLEKISSGSEGNSLRETLAHVLQRDNEVKLSFLAKEAGFQLLSEDFDIKAREALLTEKKVLESDRILATRAEVLPEASVDLHKDEKLILSEHVMSRQPSGDVVHSFGNQVLHAENKVEQKIFPRMVNFDKKLQSRHFTYSFFYSDGGDHLLRVLTSSLKIPSVIIVDPIVQKHYVLNEETDFSYTSLSDFVTGFVNGSLIAFQQSTSEVKSPREPPSPPFINLDFHAMDSIPQVTTHNFSELVIGFSQSDDTTSASVWKKDVVVLFSNSWCGFCQRMELIFREVCGFYKHYALKSEDDKSFLTDTFKEMKSRLPQFYFMDCTLNECSMILRSAGQREVYPSLLLFPAETKIAVSYGGDITVSNIIKFVADRGNSDAHGLFKDKGISWTGEEIENRKSYFFDDASQTTLQEDPHLQRGKGHDVLHEYKVPEKLDRDRQYPRPHNANVLHLGRGSLLIATEKLLRIHPFDNSIILVVMADEDEGFQGLIMNKHIRWDSLEELKERFEMLKDARLSLGGPLIKQGRPLVALSKRTTSNQFPKILPDIHFLDQQATVYEIEELKMRKCCVTDYWFFLGYSSWGWDQLFDEINEGAWNISDANYENIDWPWT